MLPPLKRCRKVLFQLKPICWQNGHVNENERRVTIKEEPSTSNNDSKLDTVVRSLALLLERSSISDRNPPRDDTPAPQIRTPISGETLLKSDKEIPGDQRDQRDQRGPDQPIRPPLQENYADDGGEVNEELEDTHINLMGIHDNEAIFLTREEEELFLLNQTKVSEEAGDEAQQDLENAILKAHRQYDLHSRKTVEAPPKKMTETQKMVESKKTPEPSTEKTPGKVPEKNKADAPVKKNITILKRPA
jgi:hypothetical protein